MSNDTTASSSIYVSQATLDQIANSGFVKHEITVRTEPNEGWVALGSAAAPSQSAPLDERALFQREVLRLDIVADEGTWEGVDSPNGWYYFDDEVNACWKTWQARAALARAPQTERIQPLPAQGGAQADEMVRFCPHCARIGDVGNEYRDCCPDGNSARHIPRRVAEVCRDTFKLAISSVAADKCSQVLKGVGKINGDGWKDVTRKGEVVFVWNTELPRPYKAGQYPRIGNNCGWSASTDQYDFQPATTEEARDAVEAIIDSYRSAAPAQADDARDAARLDFMVSDKCIMDRTETADGTRYWLSWPYLYEEQSEVYKTPREAIDAQIAIAASLAGKDKK